MRVLSPFNPRAAAGPLQSRAASPDNVDRSRALPPNDLGARSATSPAPARRPLSRLRAWIADGHGRRWVRAFPVGLVGMALGADLLLGTAEAAVTLPLMAGVWLAAGAVLALRRRPRPAGLQGVRAEGTAPAPSPGVPEPARDLPAARV